jgi:hypothetical protein
MKIVVFASLFSGAAAASCQVCGGAGYREDTVIPSADLDYASCEDVVSTAAVVDESSDECLILRYAVEALCCPSVASTCSICQGAQLDYFLEIPESDGVNCGQLAYYVAGLDISSQNCTDIQDVEVLCCPVTYDPPETMAPTSPPISVSSPTSSSTTCQVCDGVEIREDMEIPLEELDGVTCADDVATASNLDAFSELCDAYKFSEALCCPSAASTCSICKGTKLYDDVVVPGTDGMTCVEVAYSAAIHEIASENCTAYENTEAFCCPDPEVHSSKCYLCGEDGVGEMDDVQVPNLEDGLTCGDFALVAVAYEETSEECFALESLGVVNFCCGISTSAPSAGSISSPPPTSFLFSPPPTPYPIR